MKKPAAVSGAGIYDIGDDANVPLICPPRQVAKANAVQHCAIEAKSLGRGWRTCGAHSSTCADALVGRLADFADEAAMPVICSTCQMALFTAAPDSPGERALAWVAQAPPAASIQSA
jgi:hypothetical protein